MLILDTNIISELLKANPDPAVMRWFKSLDTQPLATTAITTAELYYGVAALPDGQRKTDISAALTAALNEFKDLIFPFDDAAAAFYASLSAHLRMRGKPIGQSDTMIAAITLSHDGVLVTRNTRHFEPCGIKFINPFAFG